MPKLYLKSGDPFRLPDKFRAGRSSLASDAFPDGCYRLNWCEEGGIKYEGSLRVYRSVNGVPDVSADLYLADLMALQNQAGDEIPIFSREKYRYYLQFTAVQEMPSPSGGIELQFDRVERLTAPHLSNVCSRFDERWKRERSFRVRLFAAGDRQYVGEICEDDRSSKLVGSVRLNWISPWLRAATIEIDCEEGVPIPVDNGDNLGWASVGTSIGWKITPPRVARSIPSLSSGKPWKDVECHKAMLKWRAQDSVLDREWRYHLLCVAQLHGNEQGLMYDINAADSNNVVREGAVVAANWKIPDRPTWGGVRGRLQHSVPAVYFRTAVHEIAHAMSLYHDTGEARFMSGTTTVEELSLNPSSPFIEKLVWAFDSADEMFLRHAPDPLVRPGGDRPAYHLETGEREHYVAVPAPAASDLELSLNSLSSEVPLGAPVRVVLSLKLNRAAGETVQVPYDISLKGRYLSGRVFRENEGSYRSFQPLILREGDTRLEALTPGGSKQASLTLLRGGEGALFPVEGGYRIEVTLRWQDAGRHHSLVGSTRVTVTGAGEDDKHQTAADVILKTPDSLLTLVLGGDHVSDGISAIEQALNNPILRPHYAWIEAKRRAALSIPGEKEFRSAARLIDIKTVLSPDERRQAKEQFVSHVSSIQKWRLSLCLQPQDFRWPVLQWLLPSLDRILMIVARILRQ